MALTAAYRGAEKTTKTISRPAIRLRMVLSLLDFVPNKSQTADTISSSELETQSYHTISHNSLKLYRLDLCHRRIILVFEK